MYEEHLDDQDEEILDNIKTTQDKSFKNRINRKRVSKFDMDDIFLSN